MPNFSGIWTVTQQMQAKGASTWPATPGAPTIGTATAGVNNCGSVTFTAPSCTGYPAGVTGYRVISTPGCFTNTGASSPIVVSGLTNGSSYTFKVQATNSTGYGALSAASNSITAVLPTCNTYTTAGTFTWVAPTGVTSIAILAVGGGGGGRGNTTFCCGCTGGGGGGLAYRNGFTVTPGNSYTVVVSAGQTGLAVGSNAQAPSSSFNSTTVIATGGRMSGCGGSGTAAGGTVRNGGTGGNRRAGGGAAGYSGNGGIAVQNASGTSVSGGGGGGGGSPGCNGISMGGGGGVGILGEGSSGAGGTGNATNRAGGGGGSGGASGTAGSIAGVGGNGGAYGGGGGAGIQSPNYAGGNGAGGAVRIVWAGGSRGTPSFPSTNVGA